MELSLIIMVIGISLTLSTIVLLALIPFFSYFNMSMYLGGPTLCVQL